MTRHPQQRSSRLSELDSLFAQVDQVPMPVPVRIPVGEASEVQAGIHDGRDSQHVLKAEAERPDATDRESPANGSPVGGPMGAGQPAAAGPVGDLVDCGECRAQGCRAGLCDLARRTRVEQRGAA
jgi:hypothetical protein